MLRSKFFLFVFTALFSGAGHARQIAHFADMKTFYDSGTVPSLAEFSASQLTGGFAIYSNRPEVLVPMFNLIFVEPGSSTESQVYQNAYFSDHITNLWTIENFIEKLRAIQTKLTPLEVDLEEGALKTLYQGTIPNIHFLRIAESDGKLYLVQKFQCGNPSGCRLPYQGTSFHHFPFNEVISYAYFDFQP